MTREEAIEWMEVKRSTVIEVPDRPQGARELIQAYDMAIEALKVVEPKHGKWIPCSERLPEKDGSYLVCMSWGYYDMNVYMWADGWNCIRRINGEIDRQNEIDGADIIAWMPLPIPYKESEENHEG